MNVSRKKIADVLHKTYLFHYLEKNHIDLILDNAEIVFFPAEKMVYLEGIPASFFYIVFQGQLEIIKEKHHALIQMNNLKESYSFGEDALIKNQKRRTSARAITDLILIKVSDEILSKLSEENTGFRKKLNIMLASYEHLLHRAINLGKDESVRYIGRAHPITVVLKIISALVAVLGLGILLVLSFNSGLLPYTILFWGISALAVSLLVWTGWQFLEWANDNFFFTDKRVINQQRSLFSFEIQQETPISAIESVQAKRSFFGRGLNFGNLEVKTFTGSMQLTFVPEISSVKNILTFLTKKRKERWEEEEKKAFEKDIRERIAQGFSRREGSSGNQPDQPSSLIPSQDSISEKFADQNTQTDITYHTHWTILFAKTFIPVLLLISHILVYFFLTVNNIEIIKRVAFNIIMVINSLVLMGWSAYRFFDWRNDVYIITEDQLIDIDRRPFGMEEKRSAPIKNIQSIRYKRNGIFGLLFNFGTVYTRIGDEEFTFDNVFRPAEVQETLFAAKEIFHQKEKEAEKISQRKQAVDWIDSYHQVIKEQNKDDLSNSSSEDEKSL